MIKKYFDLNNKITEDYKFYLFYGNNEGLKNEIFKKLIGKRKIFFYDEKEILDDEINFNENLLTKSLFDEIKVIMIKRSTDKILKIIEKLEKKNIDNTLIVLNSNNLENACVYLQPNQISKNKF